MSKKLNGNSCADHAPITKYSFDDDDDDNFNYKSRSKSGLGTDSTYTAYGLGSRNLLTASDPKKYNFGSDFDSGSIDFEPPRRPFRYKIFQFM